MSSANWPDHPSSSPNGRSKLNEIINIATVRIATQGAGTTWDQVLSRATDCRNNDDHTTRHRDGTDAQLFNSVTRAKDFATGGLAGKCSAELEHPGVGGGKGGKGGKQAGKQAGKKVGAKGGKKGAKKKPPKRKPSR